MAFFFAYSPWLLLLCAAGAAGLSYFLYRLSSEQEQILGTSWRYILSAFRFIVLFIISVLLLEPLLKTTETRVEKPVVLLAVDQSQSVLLSRDSTFNRTGLKPALEALQNRLEDDFDVKLLGFGNGSFDAPDFKFREKVTDIDKTVEDINLKYGSSNLGALIMVSDGIINQGSNPLYNLEQLKAPVFAVALGDTTSKVDAAVKSVKFNKLVFKGNQFPVLVEAKADKLPGRSGQVAIFSGGKRLDQRNFQITGNTFHQELAFLLKAEKPGLQQYTVSITTFDGENNVRNNTQSFFIEVVENRERILIAFSHPHPDVGALRQAIAASENYEVVMDKLGAIPADISKFGAVIFHQSGMMDAAQKNAVSALLKGGKPILFCLGSNSDLNWFNGLELGLRIQGTGNQNQVQARYNENFQLFHFDSYTPDELQDLPPLSVPFGEYSAAGSVVPLFTQQLDRLATTLPLIAFSDAPGGRRGFILGEGIWRWRMASYARHQDHQKFNSMISKMVQFLAANANRRNFIVNYKKQLDENEGAFLTAELYDAAFEFVPGNDIQFTLRKDDSVSYEYSFNKGEKSYDLVLRNLAPGRYTFVASTVLGGKNLREAGGFVVSSMQMEAVTTVADHSLLFQMAKNTGGTMVYPPAIASLEQKIRSNPMVKPVSYSTASLNDAIKLKWIFFLLVALLTAEWFVRKRSGLY